MFEWEEEMQNDRWITVHPHGKDEKGQSLLVKDGETNKEAIERKFGDGKNETKERRFKDKTGKTHSLQEMIEKGFYPNRYDSSLWDNKPSWSISDDKHEYQITEDEYKKALEYRKQKKEKDLQKAKDKAKPLTEYIKWQTNSNIEPFITKQDDNKTIIDWKTLPRKTQADLKSLQRDGKIKLDMYSGREMSVEAKDTRKLLDSLEKKQQYEMQNAKDWAKVYTGKNAMYQGVATYQDESVLLTNETLKEYINDLKGKPVLINHKSGICPENMNDDAVGYVTEAYYNSETGNFDCKFIIKDDEAKDLIKQGYSVSTAYIPTEYGAGGSYINTPYDKEVKGLKFTHLALVPDPRYEEAKIYENSKTAIEEKENCKMEKIEVEQGFLSSLLNLVGEKFNACKKNEADEEKTDKRKLIDEVGGILKGKVDEEVLKTVIGKIEKVAYTGSEASEKDNEADDDKKEEKTENLKDVVENEEEKENSKHFEKMQELLNSREAQDDKIEVYTQAKGLERGKQIYG